MLTIKLKITLLLTAILLFGATAVLAKSENANSPQGQGNVVVGNVEEVKNDKITVDDDKGKGKKVEAALDSQVEVIKQRGKSAENKGKGNASSSIKKTDKVAIISDEATKPGKVGKVVKIFVKEATEAAQSKRRAVQGVITEINGFNLTIAHQIHRERISSVSGTAATVIKMKGVEGASFSSLEVGQRVVAMGDVTPGGGILAKRIHVIPGKATGITRRFPVASSSTSPAASASATPAATPVATPEPSVEPTPEPSP